VPLIPPSLSGVAGVGGVLTCDRGVWRGKPPPSFAFQWYRDAAPIPGVTTPSYTVQASDGGTVISCIVTASNTEGARPAETQGVAIPISNTKPLTKGPSGTSGQAGYQGTSGPTVSQLLQALESAFGHLPSSARIKRLLRSGGWSFSFSSLAAGVLEVVWTQVPKGHVSSKHKPAVIARVTVSFTAAGKQTIKLKLTSAGRRLLRRSTGMKITARASFTRPAKLPAIWTKVLKLKP
jgi:hypothetical protein